uniref:Uncharacterized protein n=1 Tax=Glossina austeni TaxID=7395 RepID=A0A1A9VE44_GLOAU
MSTFLVYICPATNHAVISLIVAITDIVCIHFTLKSIKRSPLSYMTLSFAIFNDRNGEALEIDQDEEQQQNEISIIKTNTYAVTYIVLHSNTVKVEEKGNEWKTSINIDTNFFVYFGIKLLQRQYVGWLTAYIPLLEMMFFY